MFVAEPPPKITPREVEKPPENEAGSTGSANANRRAGQPSGEPRRTTARRKPQSGTCPGWGSSPKFGRILRLNHHPIFQTRTVRLNKVTPPRPNSSSVREPGFEMKPEQNEGLCCKDLGVNTYEARTEVRTQIRGNPPAVAFFIHVSCFQRDKSRQNASQYTRPE